MAHLTKPAQYDIKDSNIALLGSDLEKNVREHAGDSEAAWSVAGKEVGVQIWRIEKFNVVDWAKRKYGTFYDGDSYIVLNTYKKTPDSDALSYDLHFWLGQNTTQDEAGTAAYKTVELDDHLHGLPVQYRETQGRESSRFLSYFPRFTVLKGGVSTGFHEVADIPPPELRRLYRITFTRGPKGNNLRVREVNPEAESLVQGDAYVLDKGTKILQFNSKGSAPQEKFKAAEFVKELQEPRKGLCELVVYDEGGPGAGVFFAEFEAEGMREHEPTSALSEVKPILYKLSDASGQVEFSPLPSDAGLDSSDAFLLDAQETVFVWIGSGASLTERKLSGEYAQRYLWQKEGADPSIPIVRLSEGRETNEFTVALQDRQ